MIGEPDAGKPHVRFDEGVQETCGSVTRLCPTLPGPHFLKKPSSSCFFLPCFDRRRGFGPPAPRTACKHMPVM